MTRAMESMIVMSVTFMLVVWTMLLIFVGYKLNNEVKYLTETTYYHSQVLNVIQEDLEPISQFKGLTKYRTFSCKIGDGQIYYD
jgi:hypothetical protein